MKRLKVFPAFLFCMILSMPLVADGDDTLHMRKKLKTIIIPKIRFVDTSVRTVLEFLKKRSRELDTEGAGVNFMLILKPEKRSSTSLKSKKADLVERVIEPTVTMDMDNLPLEDVIRFICTQTGLVHVVESHAVVVMDKRVTRQKLELRIFHVDPRLFRDVKDLKKFFEEKGVSFPVSNK